jgi:uncharacterized membrane protein SpoIIM required for sporulation
MLKILQHQKLIHYIIISTFILLSGCIVSLLLNLPNTTITPQFNFSSSPISTMTTNHIFQSVVIQNLLATFLILSIGMLNIKIISSLITTLFMFVNGYNIGTLISLLNYNPNIIIATVFPHGFLEFPLMVITGAFSFILIYELQKTKINFIKLLAKHKNPNVKFIVKNYLFYPYLIIIIPWVLVAAFIEATITVWNLKSVIGL